MLSLQIPQSNSSLRGQSHRRSLGPDLVSNLVSFTKRLSHTPRFRDRQMFL
jgi:hypothetical protein